MKTHIKSLCGLMLLQLSLSVAYAQNLVFLEPKDGATVESKFKIRLNVKGIKLAPAGNTEPGTGHNHVLVNQEIVAEGEEIPFTRRHIHLNRSASNGLIGSKTIVKGWTRTDSAIVMFYHFIECSESTIVHVRSCQG